MDVDSLPGPVDGFEGPILRTKYEEFFKGHFGAIDEVDKKVLEVQNRELFLHLQARRSELDQMAQQLALLKDTQAINEKKMVSMAFFLDECVADLRLLCQKSSNLSLIPNCQPSEVFLNVLMTSDGGVVLNTDLSCDTVLETRKELLSVFSSVLSSIEDGRRERDKIWSALKKSEITHSDEALQLECARLKSELSLFEKKNEERGSIEKSLNQKVLTLKEALENEKLKNKLICDENAEMKWQITTQQRLLGRLELKMCEMDKRSKSKQDSSSPIGDDTNDTKSENVVLNANSQSVGLSQDVQDWRYLAESRLSEIEMLRSEKIQLINEMASVSSNHILTAASSIDHMQCNDLKGMAEPKYIDEQSHQLVLSENAIQQKKMSELLDEILTLRTCQNACLEGLAKEYKTQAIEIQHNLDRMTEKLKKMEQNRDQAKYKYQQLKISTESMKEDLARNEKKTKSLLTSRDVCRSELQEVKVKCIQLQEQLASKTVHTVSDLQTELEVCKTQIGILEKGQTADVIQGAELCARLKVMDAERQEMVSLAEERKKEIESLSMAIDTYYTAELQSTSELMEQTQGRLVQKEAKLDEYRSEVLSLRTAAGQKKKEDSMRVEGQAALVTKVGYLRSLLQDEVDQNKNLSAEIERLSRECIKLRQIDEKQRNVVTQCGITASLCEKKVREMGIEVKTAHEKLALAQNEMEQMKNRCLRLSEELETTKRHLHVLQPNTNNNGNRRTSSETKNKGDSLLAFYQRTYNCTLCSRERAADSILMTCFHAFCSQCIEEKCIKPRNRKCPACNKKFDKIDVHEIFFI